MAYLYSKKVMELFRHPKGCRKMKNPDATSQVGSMICGDIMKVYLKVGERDGKLFVKDISFQSFGCVANISSSSQTVELAKGKTLEEAVKIKNMDIIRELGGLPSIKIHCSVLAVDGLREAIYNYLKRKKLPIPKEALESHKRVQKELKDVEHMREKILK